MKTCITLRMIATSTIAIFMAISRLHAQTRQEIRAQRAAQAAAEATELEQELYDAQIAAQNSPRIRSTSSVLSGNSGGSDGPTPMDSFDCGMSFQHVQSENTPFGELGGNHHYFGQLIKPSCDVSIARIDMEMKCDGICASTSGYIDAEIWRTDAGNNWVHVANSLTRITYVDDTYRIRTWYFQPAVTLAAGNSYFVGINVPSDAPHVIVRGDHTGFAGTDADLPNGIGAPDCNYQEAWCASQNNQMCGAGTAYVTTYSIVFTTTIGKPTPFDPAPERDYALVDLGTLGGTASWAYGINNAGQVVGLSLISGDSAYRAFQWQNGTMQNLGTLGGGSSYCFGGLNANGQVVGSSFTSGGGPNHAFSYSGNTMTDIGTLGLNGSSSTSGASAVNAGGTIVGVSDSHAFKYSGSTMTDLGTFPGETMVNAGANGINDSGDIAGVAKKSGIDRSFIIPKDGVMQDIGDLYGNGGTAYAINSYSEVVGQSAVRGGTIHAYFYDISMQDLGVLSGDTGSAAYGLNNKAHVVGASASGSSTRAFLFSNGSIKDLNNITVNASGWTLQVAWAINDNEQIVGWGSDPSGHVHAYLLNPLPLGSKQVITENPSIKTYGITPTKDPSKDKLVVITHGWELKLLGVIEPDISWVDDMKSSIINHLPDSTWQVHAYKWVPNAWRFLAEDALNNAKEEGINLGKAIASQGWTHIHLIGHSAGAEVIQKAAEIVKATPGNTTTVQCTFLDAYVGKHFQYVSSYGNHTDWSDQYFTRDALTHLNVFGIGPFTESILDHAYNVDVSQLDPNRTPGTKFRSSETGEMELCYKTLPTHEGPHVVYEKSVTGNVTSDYFKFGFPLSKEGGWWDYATTHFFAGGLTNIGNPDPTCATDIQVTPPTWASKLVGFLGFPTAWASTTGTSQETVDSLKLFTSSPVWIAKVVSHTNPVNTVSFDAEFTSSAGAGGLLSLYWDANVIGSVDEKTVGPGLQHYSLSFSRADANTTHVLGFRLDPFTNIQSVVTLTNVVLNQIGVSQPFSLALITNRVNGQFVYELRGEAGFEYIVQASTNLTDWTTITSLANTNGTVRFFDVTSTNYPTRFYRAVAPY